MVWRSEPIRYFCLRLFVAARPEFKKFQPSLERPKACPEQGLAQFADRLDAP